MQQQIIQLDNQLKTVLIQIPQSPSVTVLVLVHTGSRFESPDIAGLAHFVEHMFFKGTKQYPSSLKLALAMENIGGTSNAFTSYEYTGYFIKVPQENFASAIEILSDIVQNAIFLEEEIVKESGVICEEIKMYEDIPMDKIARIFQESLFKNSTLAGDIAGSIKTVKNFKAQNFKEFAAKFYTANNMTLVVAGHLNEKETVAIIKENFSAIKLGKKHQAELVNEITLRNNFQITTQELEQVHIIVGGRSINREDPRRYALKVGNAILGFGFGSLLFQEIREKLGAAYYVHSSIHEFSDTGKYEISVGLDRTKLEIGITSISHILKKLIKGIITEEELNRAKNLLMGYITSELDNSEDLAEFFGIQYLLTGKIVTPQELILKIKTIQLKDVVEIWQEILQPENIFASVLGPVSLEKLDKYSIL
ncbi:MAG: pitrilysin family protein [bacterium]